MKSKLAVTAFVLGLVSFFQLFGLEKAILAIIFGTLALKEISAGEMRGKNYAYAGVVLGILYILIVVIILIVKGPAMVSHLEKIR